MAKEEIEFVDGLIVKAPHERAPDFVKAQISIKVEKLQSWLAGRGKDEEWVNIDVKVSKGGKWYAAVSNFKPKAKDDGQQAPKTGKGRFDDMKDDDPDSIPF